MFLLWILLPIWIAALIVTFLVGTIAPAMVRSAVAGFEKIRPAPQRTLESVKENMEWAKGQMP